MLPWRHCQHENTHQDVAPAACNGRIESSGCHRNARSIVILVTRVSNSSFFANRRMPTFAELDRLITPRNTQRLRRFEIQTTDDAVELLSVFGKFYLAEFVCSAKNCLRRAGVIFDER